MKIYNSNFLSIGVDEVGRGAIAGPVVACASCLDYSNIPDGIKDSKKLSKTTRENLNNILVDKNSSHFFAIGSASIDEIDEMNILNATMLAMKRAVLSLIADIAISNPDLLKKVKIILIDGNKIPNDLPFEALSVVKGDDKYLEIAAASVVAKVFRDKLMSDLSIEMMEYSFHKNAGYGTKTHFDAIARFGITPYHRKTFLTNMKQLFFVDK